VSASLAGYLVSILNAASVFGHTIPAYAADRFIGRFSILISMAIITTILVLGMWIRASSNAAIVVFAALFGFTSGSIVTITPALVAQISDVRQIGVRTGTIFTIASIAVLISNPIAGALVVADNGGFLKLQIFARCVMVGGCVFLVVARIKLAGLDPTAKV
jgi:MFS family permease